MFKHAELRPWMDTDRFPRVHGTHWRAVHNGELYDLVYDPRKTQNMTFEQSIKHLGIIIANFKKSTDIDERESNASSVDQRVISFNQIYQLRRQNVDSLKASIVTGLNKSEEGVNYSHWSDIEAYPLTPGMSYRVIEGNSIIDCDHVSISKYRNVVFYTGTYMVVSKYPKHLWTEEEKAEPKSRILSFKQLLSNKEPNQQSIEEKETKMEQNNAEQMAVETTVDQTEKLGSSVKSRFMDTNSVINTLNTIMYNNAQFVTSQLVEIRLLLDPQKKKVPLAEVSNALDKVTQSLTVCAAVCRAALCKVSNYSEDLTEESLSSMFIDIIKDVAFEMKLNGCSVGLKFKEIRGILQEELSYLLSDRLGLEGESIIKDAVKQAKDHRTASVIL